MRPGRKTDAKGTVEVFALCLQENQDKALVVGMEITPSLAAAAFEVSWERAGETEASSRTGCCYDPLRGQLFIC